MIDIEINLSCALCKNTMERATCPGPERPCFPHCPTESHTHIWCAHCRARYGERVITDLILRVGEVDVQA